MSAIPYTRPALARNAGWWTWVRRGIAGAAYLPSASLLSDARRATLVFSVVGVSRKDRADE
jgi:hypothetical protein